MILKRNQQTSYNHFTGQIAKLNTIAMLEIMQEHFIDLSVI